MDQMDELKRMLQEAEGELPFRPNSLRKELDFQIMPHLLYANPAAFLHNCLQDREQFLCDLFCRYYSQRIPQEPKTFHRKAFSVHRKPLGDNRELLYIGLPEEFAESMEFCRAYVLTWQWEADRMVHVRFHTIEDSMYGWKNLGYISPEGEHIRFAHPTGDLPRDLNTICSHAFPERGSA